MIETRITLSGLYGTNTDTTFLRTKKDSILRKLEQDLSITSGKLNNAALVPISTYHTLIPYFQGILDSCGGDFRQFYEAVEK